MENAYLVPNPIAPCPSVIIDDEKCISCNSCAKVCRTQTIMPNPEKGKPPIVIYPDECWFCSCCVESCKKDAIKLHYPINQRIFFKRKETGEIYRIGGPDSPPQSYFKPAVGSR
ncbi:MAG: 4Fe-4S binding protein [Oscillospiraceae bacterium]|nr:4Fe-4S binding protein [Oscillospiraceae bacterium]